MVRRDGDHRTRDCNYSLLGIGGMQLYRAEMSGPMKDQKIQPRIAETAKALWFVYFLF